MSTAFILPACLRSKVGSRDTSKNEACSLRISMDPCTPPYTSSYWAYTTIAIAYQPHERECHELYSSVAVASSSSGILPVPEANAPGVNGVPARKSSMSKSSCDAPWRLPRTFPVEAGCCSCLWPSVPGTSANPTVVCLRLGDICRSAERFTGDSFFNVEREARAGLWLNGVCIVGTLDEWRGFWRLGVEPF